MSTTITPEQLQAAHELMMSPTMQGLCTLAQTFPLNPQDRDDMKTGFCTSSMEIIRALDHNRIHFERQEDRAMLHGLLLVVMETVFDGRF